MTIIANGEPYNIPLDTSLSVFLKSQGQAIGRVVVELNGEALAPSESNTVVLKENDRLEIVRIVAGG